MESFIILHRYVINLPFPFAFLLLCIGLTSSIAPALALPIGVRSCGRLRGPARLKVERGAGIVGRIAPARQEREQLRGPREACPHRTGSSAARRCLEAAPSAGAQSAPATRAAGGAPRRPASAAPPAARGWWRALERSSASPPAGPGAGAEVPMVILNPVTI